MGKREIIAEIRDVLERRLFDSLDEMLVAQNQAILDVLAVPDEAPGLSEEDVDRIARRMLYVFMHTPIERVPIVFTGGSISETFIVEPPQCP